LSLAPPTPASWGLMSLCVVGVVGSVQVDNSVNWVGNQPSWWFFAWLKHCAGPLMLLVIKALPMHPVPSPYSTPFSLECPRPKLWPNSCMCVLTCVVACARYLEYCPLTKAVPANEVPGWKIMMMSYRSSTSVEPVRPSAVAAAERTAETALENPAVV